MATRRVAYSDSKSAVLNLTRYLVAFDGLYYVKSVTHSIKRGEYKQSFSLARNGLLSTVPKVPA